MGSALVAELWHPGKKQIAVKVTASRRMFFM
jgi:hypothetical protein